MEVANRDRQFVVRGGAIDRASPGL